MGWVHRIPVVEADIDLEHEILVSDDLDTLASVSFRDDEKVLIVAFRKTSGYGSDTKVTD